MCSEAPFRSVRRICRISPMPAGGPARTPDPPHPGAERWSAASRLGGDCGDCGRRPWVYRSSPTYRRCRRYRPKWVGLAFGFRRRRSSRYPRLATLAERRCAPSLRDHPRRPRSPHRTYWKVSADSRSVGLLASSGTKPRPVASTPSIAAGMHVARKQDSDWAGPVCHGGGSCGGDPIDEDCEVPIGQLRAQSQTATRLENRRTAALKRSMIEPPALSTEKARRPVDWTAMIDWETFVCSGRYLHQLLHEWNRRNSDSKTLGKRQPHG